MYSCGYHRFTVLSLKPGLPGLCLGRSLWKPCREESIDGKAPEAQAWQYISASRSLEGTCEQSHCSTGTCSTAEPAQHCAQGETSSCAPGPGLHRGKEGDNTGFNIHHHNTEKKQHLGHLPSPSKAVMRGTSQCSAEGPGFSARHCHWLQGQP